MSNDDLLSRWSRPNPLHFAALIIHSQQIAFSFSCRLDSIHALFPSKNRSVSPGNRQEQSLQAKSEASQLAPCADALLSWALQPPVHECFRPLCPFLSAEGLSLRSLL